MELRRVVKIERLRDKREEKIIQKVKDIAQSPFKEGGFKIVPENQERKAAIQKMKGSLGFLKDSNKLTPKQRVITPEKPYEGRRISRKDSIVNTKNGIQASSDILKPRNSSLELPAKQEQRASRINLPAGRKSKWDWSKSQAKVQALIDLKSKFPKLGAFTEFSALKTTSNVGRKQAVPVAHPRAVPNSHLTRTSISRSGSFVSAHSTLFPPKQVTSAEVRCFLSQINPLSPPKTLHTPFLKDTLQALGINTTLSSFSTAIEDLDRHSADGVTAQHLEDWLSRPLPATYDAGEDICKLLGNSADAQYKNVAKLLKASGLGTLSQQEWEYIRTLLDFDGDGLLQAKDLHKTWNILTSTT